MNVIFIARSAGELVKQGTTAAGKERKAVSRKGTKG
jgi:hypothetical protein